MTSTAVKVSLVDDHGLFRRGIGVLVEGFDGYEVLGEASNGREFIDNLSPENLPDIVLMDIDMPEMNGYETCQWMHDNHPDVKVLALSMYKDEQAIIRMLKAGARGYLLKESEADQLYNTLEELRVNGYYHSEKVGKALMDNLHSPVPTINDTELTFLRFACTELTYKEIADKMNVSPRTIDNYRESLFEKLDIKSRIGLAIYAIRHGIYRV